MFKTFLQRINKHQMPAKSPAKDSDKVGGTPFFAPVAGFVKDISKAPDSSYANKQLGDGVFILPNDHKIYAPCDCQVVFIFPNNQALGLRTQDGLEFLLSLEMDNHSSQASGFSFAVEEDQDVKKGTLLCEFDSNYIEGSSPVVRIHLIATNLEKTQQLTCVEDRFVTLEDIIFEIASYSFAKHIDTI